MIFLIYIIFQIVFHGIKASQEEIVLDGSEAPVRVDAEALLASEKLTPVANLKKVILYYLVSFCSNSYILVMWDSNEVNLVSQFMSNLQIRVPYRPVDAKISALSNDRDRLPSGKQILALTLT
jgi:tripeptidyl-peptidase-2